MGILSRARWLATDRHASDTASSAAILVWGRCPAQRWRANTTAAVRTVRSAARTLGPWWLLGLQHVGPRAESRAASLRTVRNRFLSFQAGEATAWASARWPACRANCLRNGFACGWSNRPLDCRRTASRLWANCARKAELERLRAASRCSDHRPQLWMGLSGGGES